MTILQRVGVTIILSLVLFTGIEVAIERHDKKKGIEKEDSSVGSCLLGFILALAVVCLIP